MRILLTGGQGQVGSALGQLGTERNLDLVVLDRTNADITNLVSVADAFERHKPDLVINAAAYTAVDKAEGESDLAFRINQQGTENLALACSKVDIPLFHISTDYVFDGQKLGLYTETDAVNPIDVYARSKEAGETVLREKLSRHLILRTSWVFGETGHNFVKTMVRLGKERDRLSVVDDQFGGPTSARAIAEVLLQIAKHYESEGSLPWGTYHFSQLPHLSWFGFAQEIVSIAQGMRMLSKTLSVDPIPSEQFPTPVKRPVNSRLDSSKLSRTFGIEITDWHKDVKSVLETL